MTTRKLTAEEVDDLLGFSPAPDDVVDKDEVMERLRETTGRSDEDIIGFATALLLYGLEGQKDGRTMCLLDPKTGDYSEILLKIELPDRIASEMASLPENPSDDDLRANGFKTAEEVFSDLDRG